jgi:hypothetical protein
MKRSLPPRLLGALALLIAGAAVWLGRGQFPIRPDRPPVPFEIRPRDLADCIHAVVASHREVYARLVVQRLSEEAKIVPCSENWEADKALPVPTQVLRLANEAVQRKGAEFAVVARSLHPLNPRNRPETDTERLGLESFRTQPDQTFYTNEMAGGRRYFTAVYPDKAIVPACVHCHNAHPNSPRKDFKPGDVLGGIVVRVPLEF